MTKQRSLEERLADTQAQRQKIEERLKKLGQQQKALDQRKQLRGEKIVLQQVLGWIERVPEFRAGLMAELAAANLKPEDRDAALWVLTSGKNEIDAKPGLLTEDAIPEQGHPEERAA